jgi:hypothetical protein
VHLLRVRPLLEKAGAVSNGILSVSRRQVPVCFAELFQVNVYSMWLIYDDVS